MSHPTQHVQPVGDLSWLSWLRFVAIGFVVTIYVVGYNAGALDARDSLRGQRAIYLEIAGAFAVPVFVMASGALLLDPSRYPGDGTFLRKRALSLVPAIVFWHLWYWVVLEVHHERDTSFHRPPQGQRRVGSEADTDESTDRDIRADPRQKSADHQQEADQHRPTR